MLKYAEFSMSHQNGNHNLRFLLDDNQPTQNIILHDVSHNLLYEEHLTLFLKQVLRQGDCFIDIGSNIGYFALVTAVLTGNDGLVLAFEPERHNYKRLQAHIAINEFDNIVAYNMAVGDEDKMVSLFFNSDNDGGHALWDVGTHSFNQKSRQTIKKQDIQLVKLDSIISKLSTPPIKVIKIDTEGYEHHVLMGATETIRKHKVPFIAAEMNRLGLRQSGSREDLLRMYMQHLGYDTYVYGCDENKNVILHRLSPDQHLHVDNKELVCDFIFSTDEHLSSYGFTVRG